MTTIERIARAIKANRFRRTGREALISEMDAPTDNELDDVRAALQALRQVDEGTVEAMADAAETFYVGDGKYLVGDELNRASFTAAIDHILSQGGEG